jgi:hypothetical protein
MMLPRANVRLESLLHSEKQLSGMDSIDEGIQIDFRKKQL